MSGPSPLSSTERHDTDARVGSTLSERYRIDRLLGEGGMGRVYAATHLLMKKRVAVKVLHRDLTKVPEVVARFEREAMAAANIDHPNVAAATDFGKLDDGSVFLVLEFVSGRSLRAEIQAGALSLDRVLHVARQMASALARAHELEIVHRDLKPENVMLVEKGQDADFVKVLDFGIAKVPVSDVAGVGAVSKPGEAITRAGVVYGTPEYMPPEQALGQQVDARADLFALGVIIFEMLTGTRPFGGGSQVEVLGQQLSGAPPTLASKGVAVPQVIEQVVRTLLAKDVDLRVQSAVELVQWIDSVRGRPGSMPDPRAGSIPDAGSNPEHFRPITVPDITVPGSIPDARPPSFSDVSSPGSPLALPAPSPTSGSRVAPAAPGIGTWVDQLRPKGALSRVPTAVWVVGVGLFVVGVVFAASAFVARAFSGSPTEPIGSSQPTPIVGTDPRAELEKAKGEGVNALEAHAAGRPTDTAVLLELAKAYELDRNVPAAVGAVGRALRADPALSNDEWIASALWRASQSKDAGEAAFALLEGPMGAKGADILYDLVTTEGIRQSVLTRAEEYLRSPAFQARSTPSLNVAVALRYAERCQQFNALILRAKSQGDKRALPILRKLERRGGCGRAGGSDCYPCLREDERLEDAIEAIEKRERG